MIRVFPRKTKWTPTDDLAFVGEPPQPGLRPCEQPVCVSVCFTWDIDEGRRLKRAWSDHYSEVSIGGPAFGDAGYNFTPGQFIKKGVTFTSRGCPGNCPWCFVPAREGGIRELEIKDGWIVQDNNLLACSRLHIEAVFQMLRRQPHAATFAGGFEARRFDRYIRDLLDTIRLKQVWFACDTHRAFPRLAKAAALLDGIPENKRRCYVMIGRGDSIPEAEARLRGVLNLGFLPLAMPYQGPVWTHYPKEWKDLARYWSRPAIYKSSKTAKAGVKDG